MNMSDNAIPGHRYLSADHAKSTEADQEWDRDNQQWWDWYMSLAENEPDESKEPLIELPQPISHPAPDLAALVTELRKPFALSPAQIDSFGRNGYIKLKDVLPPGALSLLRRELAAMFEQESEQLGHRFGSLEMMWEQNQIVRAFVFSTRLARLAAELLGGRGGPALPRQWLVETAWVWTNSVALRRPSFSHCHTKRLHRVDTFAGNMRRHGASGAAL
jgi:hypothetical protein